MGVRRAVAVAMAAGVLLLTGCSGGDSGDEASTVQPASGDGGFVDDSGGDADANLDAAADEAPDEGGSSTGVGQAASVPIVKAEIMKASLTVRVDDVPVAETRAEDMVIAAGGTVSGSETRTDPGEGEDASAFLTVRVPNDDLTDVLRSLAKLGTRTSEERSVQDVTAEVADVESRLANQRASIARLREFMAEATSVEDVLRIESDLTRREADLEALQARSRALADRTAQATVELWLVSGDELPAAAEENEDRGFLAGLRGGWDAFVSSAQVTLTAVGAVLPFAALAALIGIPAYRMRHRFTRARASEPA
jgi:hypothetical protein